MTTKNHLVQICLEISKAEQKSVFQDCFSYLFMLNKCLFILKLEKNLKAAKT